MTERQVQFTEQFFDRLELLFPTERGVDGTPSVTDFLLLELPAVRDRLATDFAGSTLATDDPDIRVFIGGGYPLVDSRSSLRSTTTSSKRSGS